MHTSTPGKILLKLKFPKRNAFGNSRFKTNSCGALCQVPQYPTDVQRTARRSKTEKFSSLNEMQQSKMQRRNSKWKPSSASRFIFSLHAKRHEIFLKPPYKARRSFLMREKSFLLQTKLYRKRRSTLCTWLQECQIARRKQRSGGVLEAS